jgi:hypothetical protein
MYYIIQYNIPLNRNFKTYEKEKIRGYRDKITVNGTVGNNQPGSSLPVRSDNGDVTGMDSGHTVENSCCKLK